MDQVTRASDFRRRVRRTGRRLAVVTAAVCPLVAAAPNQQEPDGLTLRTYRFWRAPGVTKVETFASVPWRALTFTTAGDQAVAHFETTLEVHDGSGTLLATQSWADSVRTPPLERASMNRASSIEHATLDLKPGRYTFTMSIKDTPSGRTVSGVDTVEAYAEEPGHSDLVLAAAISPVAGDSSVPAGALRRGNLIILPNLQGAITAEQPKVSLFAELYNQSAAPETANAVVRITNASGFEHETPPRVRVVEPGAGIEALSTSLAGLPPGDYTLALQWKYPSHTASAGDAIHMLPPGSGQVEIAAPQMYEGLTVAQLDSVFGPLRYIATKTEQDHYDGMATAEGKRRVIAEFWAAHARELGETISEFKAEVAERIAYANRNFAPPRARNRKGVLGWNTDRGRIYIMFGAPADKMVSQLQSGTQAKPWEAWKYAHGRGEMYLFVDRTGFGRYDLLFTTNPYMTSDPTWQSYLSREDLQRLQAF